MPIKIPQKLPAFEVLKRENVFVMDILRAVQQDIRPLRIGLFNLMPTKITTETQIMRLLGNTPLQVECILLNAASHKSKTTSQEHLSTFYTNFDCIKNKKLDGLVITGAPIELLPFEDVTYWDELTKVMEWSKTNVTSTLHICWGAQAALYYHYGIDKRPLPQKLFGVYKHAVQKANSRLLMGADDFFYAPHSRHTDVDAHSLERHPDIDILAVSQKAGIYLAATKDCRQVFVTGHAEYDADTLHNEYMRDLQKGLDTQMPENYYRDNAPEKLPNVNWRSHANLLFSNWINYCIYQVTPYELD